jgi:hypothetical protein
VKGLTSKIAIGGGWIGYDVHHYLRKHGDAFTAVEEKKLIIEMWPNW